MMEYPKVSVITVTYNAAGPLRKTLENLSRCNLPDLEVVVIDGASRDETSVVVRKFPDTVGYFASELDKGIYDAMNKGLAASTGDYVWYINAGDTIHDPESITRIFDGKLPGADIYYGETLIKTPEGKILGLRKKKLPKNLTWVDFFRGMVVCHQSILVKRMLAPRFDLTYEIAADIKWVLQSLRNAATIVNTDTVLSEFETGGESSRRKKQAWKERFDIMKTYFGFLPTLAAHSLFVVDSLKPEYRKWKP